MTCIFNREFPYKDVFILWDALFSFDESPQDKATMQFMDIISLAMILRIREELLEGDQNDCFSCLFQYPPLEDIHKLVLISEKIKYCMDNKTKNNNINMNVLISNAPLETNEKVLLPPVTKMFPGVPRPNVPQQQQQHQHSRPQVKQTDEEEMSRKQKLTKFFGGFVQKAVKSTIGTLEKFVDKKDNEDDDNTVSMKLMNEPTNASLITSQTAALNKLENLYYQYKDIMRQQDQMDFVAALQFLKK